MTDRRGPGDPRLARAMALHRAGERAAAEPLYRAAAAAHPGDGNYLHLLGLCLLEQGKAEEGRRVMTEAVRAAPRHAGAHYALGRALAEAGAEAAAIGHLERAAALAPARAEAHLELGTLLARRQDLRAAEAALRRGLAHLPGHAALKANLGVVLYQGGERAEAVRLWEAALAAEPRLAAAHLGIANHRCALGDLAGGEAAFRRAIACAPASAPLHLGLGAVLRRRGATEAAIAALEEARRLDPGSREAAVELARSYQSVCDWDALDRLRPMLEEEFARARRGEECALSPFFALSLPAAPEDRAAVARRRAERAKARALAEWGGAPPLAHARPQGSRLVVGYLSSDFRDHAVGHLIEGLFAAHDRARVAVHAYAIGPDDGSAYRRRFEREADRFVDLAALGNDAAARRIHADGVDILVDLNGLTQFGRPEIAALRPAPLQATWIGFPGATGADFYDYALVDRTVAPAAHQGRYAEALCRLPESYFPNPSWPPARGRPTGRAEEGLPPEAVVFCCFCTSYKIERRAFAVWMEILRQVPGSVLWLLAGGPGLEGRLREAAAAAGVAPQRLVFAPRRAKPDHLARLALADLMLDSFTYGGHTTLTDALAAGVPAVTCLGDDFASRVGASLLGAAGLDALVAPDVAAYERLALGLGRDAAALARLKADLAARLPRAPLFDLPRFARKLERAYAAMWALHAAGERPRPLDIEQG